MQDGYLTTGNSPSRRPPNLTVPYAYFGTFEIDEVAHVVTHHVVNSLIPYEKATALKREVAIDRNVLTLLTPPRDESGQNFQSSGLEEG
jgi:hypothetical protein